jgi:hypothetical protein
MANKARTKIGFNPVQIKDGWVVRMRKDGRIAEKIQPWIPGAMPKKEK